MEQSVIEAVEEDFPTVGVLTLHGKMLRCVKKCQPQKILSGMLLQMMYAAFKKKMHP